MGMALVLGALGKSIEAKERFEKVIDDNPDYSTPHFWKGCLHVHLGEFELAVEEARKALEIEKSAFMAINLAWVNAEAGKKVFARQLLDEALQAKSDEYVRPSQVSCVEFALGNDEEGFRLFEKGIAEKDTAALMQASLPWFNKYLSRDRQRWREIEEKSGLAKAISDMGN